MIKRIFALAAVLALPLFPADMAEAKTLRIDGGITKLKVTAPLGDLGLAGSPAGTASVKNGKFLFPITGGKVDMNGNAIIEHDGVGVTLMSRDGTSATVGNFVIDTEMKAILGTVGAGTDFLPLFDLSNLDKPRITVSISETLAGALTSVFGAPNLSGATFGFARTNPDVSEVPLPASALLLLAGVGAMAGLRRRKAAA